MPLHAYAHAAANNGVCHIRWHTADKIPGCLGFSIRRVPLSTVSGRTEWQGPLSSSVGFAAAPNAAREMRNTDIWPVQGFDWTDTAAPPGESFKYRIVPMVGTPGALHADESRALETAAVSLTGNFGPFSATFHRGILFSHATARTSGYSTKRKGLPQAGDAAATIHHFLEEVKGAGGSILAALPELTDEVILEHFCGLGGKMELVLANADSSEKSRGEDGRERLHLLYDGANSQHRRRIMQNGKVALTNRFLRPGAVSHHRFLVHVDRDGEAQSVLIGNVEWTAPALSLQTASVLVIRVREIAQRYRACWERLRDDTDTRMAWDGISTPMPNAQQDVPLRIENALPPPAIMLGGGTGARVWFSPNTRLRARRVPQTETPPDMEEVFRLISQAERSVLFLVSKPGSPSLAQHIRDVYKMRLAEGRRIFITGVATDSEATGQFVEVFKRGTSHWIEGPARARASRGDDSDDDFDRQQRELYQMGLAAMHGQIVVIDHCDARKCVIITGNHPLNWRASHADDGNIVIIHGRQDLALAYAAHVFDITRHFQWRWHLQQDAKLPACRRGRVWLGLAATDTWQDKYFDAAHAASHDARLLQMGLPSSDHETGEDSVSTQAAVILVTSAHGTATPGVAAV